jgi:hypothetical protein
VFRRMKSRRALALRVAQQPREFGPLGVIHIQGKAVETARRRVGACSRRQPPAPVKLQRLIPDARRGSSVTALSGRGSSDL